LHTLDLSCSTRIKSSPEVFAKLIEVLKTSQLSPAIFRLRDTAIMPVVLNEVIGNMPRLDELHLQCVVIKQQLFDHLGALQTPLDSSATVLSVNIPCPSLSTLIVDYSESKKPMTLKFTPLAASRAVKARVKAGHIMERACVRITKEQEWINLLL
jgi:hypothetical protein